MSPHLPVWSRAVRHPCFLGTVHLTLHRAAMCLGAFFPDCIADAQFLPWLSREQTFQYLPRLNMTEEGKTSIFPSPNPPPTFHPDPCFALHPVTITVPSLCATSKSQVRLNIAPLLLETSQGLCSCSSPLSRTFIKFILPMS